MQNVNLICLPFAGGSKYSYRSFQLIAPNWLKVVPIELPGRGDRIDEPLLMNLDAMANDLFIQINKFISTPYILFGHSMGGLLAYKLARKIINQSLCPPLHIVISGCEGPSVRDITAKIRSNLAPEQFIIEMRALGGIPDSLLNDESFIDFFEPILRADFRAIENEEYKKSSPIDIPICVLYGSDEEDIDELKALAWQEETNQKVNVTELSGDHFFIFKHEEFIIEMITKIALK